ncbi:MAG: hypothetical protein HGB12_00855 [Bacteroidetes bacterium]|nr:hypothetical protein [Bacteroidota bacterium]
MKKIFFLLNVLLSFIFKAEVFAQEQYQGKAINEQVENALVKNYSDVKVFFEKAYSMYPEVPKGILEAVSYHYTHFKHISYNTPESSEELPRVYGIMGLTLNGKNYFRNNLITVSILSGYSQEDIIKDTAVNVNAYAAAFSFLKNYLKITSQKPEEMLKIIAFLSELNINSTTTINDYTINLYLYGILSFLNNKENQKNYNFPDYNINLDSVFGEANLKTFK